MLTGVLFDWRGHYDKILSNRPPGEIPKRWSGLAKCQSCDSTVPSKARRCPRCGAPRSPRLLSRLGALIAIASLVAVFALCARLLGDSAPEQRPSERLGQWSDEDNYVIVEVPAAPSPFAGVAAAQESPTVR